MTNVPQIQELKPTISLVDAEGNEVGKPNDQIEQPKLDVHNIKQLFAFGVVRKLTLRHQARRVGKRHEARRDAALAKVKARKLKRKAA